MPRGVTKSRPITVSALLDAAMELFADRGYGATSIPEICERAGLTKGAFYSNFANKEALFLALLDRSWERRAESLRRAMPNGIDLPADTVDRRATSETAIDRQWTLVSMEFSLHAIRHPDVAALLVDHEVRVRSELATLVTEELEQAHRVPTVPVDRLARMIVAVTEGGRIQALTNRAGGAPVDFDLGHHAVAALLSQLSVPDPGGPVPDPAGTS